MRYFSFFSSGVPAFFLYLLGSTLIFASDLAPLAYDSSFKVKPNSKLNAQLNATGGKNEILLYSIVSHPEHGSVRLTDKRSGRFRYRPDGTHSGITSFTFRVFNGHSFSNTATVSIEIETDLPPVALKASFTVKSGSNLSGKLEGIDPEGLRLRFFLVDRPENGTITIFQSSGTFRFRTPRTSIRVSSSFTFRVFDGHSFSNPATVSIEIEPNLPPVALKASFTVSTGSILRGKLEGTDPEGLPLRFLLVDGAKNGTILRFSSSGTFRYTTNTNFSGGDTFAFRVSDGVSFSEPVSVAISDSFVITANPLSLTIDGDKQSAGQVSGQDPKKLPLSFRKVSDPNLGTLNFLANGSFTYLPTENRDFDDSFAFVADNGFGASLPATVSFKVKFVNHAPVADNLSKVGILDGSLPIQLTGSDIDRDTLSFTISNGPKHGTLTGTPPSVTYVPNPGTTDDSFTYEANDGKFKSKIATVKIGLGKIDLAVGVNFTCALFRGLIKCFGQNNLGQLGQNDTRDRGGNEGTMGDNLTEINLGTGRTVKEITAGSSHVCAILDNSKVKCWGSNSDGQLGLGDNVNRGSGEPNGPMGDGLPELNLGLGRTAKSISAGSLHTCAILDNNALTCWGRNDRGQLGLGLESADDIGDAIHPLSDATFLVNLGTGKTAKAISAGFSHTCALLNNNKVKCWGFNTKGQLGVGDAVNRGISALSMGDALPSVNLGVGRTAKAISTKGHHTCAILDTKSMTCWGLNSAGQLGIGSTEPRGNTANFLLEDPQIVNLGLGRTAKTISAGVGTTCAVLDNDHLTCWGLNNFGQLGLGYSMNRGDSTNPLSDEGQNVNLGLNRSAVEVKTSGLHTCVATQSNKPLTCFGQNNFGQLGLENSTDRGGSPNDLSDEFKSINLGSSFP